MSALRDFLATLLGGKRSLATGADTGSAVAGSHGGYRSSAPAADDARPSLASHRQRPRD